MRCDKIIDIISNEFYDIIYTGSSTEFEINDMRYKRTVTAMGYVPNDGLKGIILMDDKEYNTFRKCQVATYYTDKCYKDHLQRDEIEHHVKTLAINRT